MLAFLILAMVSCRGDEMIIPSESDVIASPDGLGGMYVLNEGNMGSNKCSLDFYDFSTGTYHRNIYPERNPDQIMELGDVGNDIAVYGSKLYVTVNCSNKVEVMDAATAEKITQIEIPNCRFLAFDKGNAYVSSYIGPVGVDPYCPLGAVFRIDTLSLTVTKQATVGYQPEEMAVANGTLFVANSGGYRIPDYDNTITAIDLNTFSESYTITAGYNMLRLKTDRYGNLWASSRGRNDSDTPALLKLTRDKDGCYQVSRRFDFSVDNFAFRGDSLLYFSSKGGENKYGVLDIPTGLQMGSFLDSELENSITRPYGLAVNPESGNIFITDAKNYVSSGTIYCCSGEGKKLWEARTGDIPAAMAFTNRAETFSPSGPSEQEDLSAYISKVYEYVPAPGQFINIMPTYNPDDSYEDMIRKCEEAICGTTAECISLGGFGGYITFGFDHPVPNIPGEKDFRIWGNAVWQSESIQGGSAEPGIVYVSYDENNNGLPDDPWYELAGSEYFSDSTIHDYSISYVRQNEEILWEDALGEDGTMSRNPYHSQSYWPGWIPENTLKFTGTCLAPNAVDVSGVGNNYILYSYPWGYADNYPNRYEEENSFDISWAVDADGNPVELPGIHFVRVMTGINQQCGPLGETSTEICKARDLHYPDYTD